MGGSTEQAEVMYLVQSKHIAMAEEILQQNEWGPASYFGNMGNLLLATCLIPRCFGRGVKKRSESLSGCDGGNAEICRYGRI